MIPRIAESEIRDLARQFKALAIVGPRQSGKTTLVRKIFSNKPYVNLENPDSRLFATEDPRGFLANYPNGAVLDEVQRVPHLFSYLQQILDEANENGMFILTGSNNFLLQENISQSLAGRIAYLNLLPLSLAEINSESYSINELLYRGLYPSLYGTDVVPAKWYANYIRTYLDRDVRLIKNITNLLSFERFIKLCAGRVGQLLNMSNLAIETGVDVKTISAWIGILEAGFVVFRLRPYYRNFNKRIVKTPKLYFVDTGLACALLGIEHAGQLEMHPLKGSIFENMVVTEFLKKRYNAGKSDNLFFWRDNTGNEIDLLIDQESMQTAIEIKSGQTITAEFFKGLQFWIKLTEAGRGYVIYAGEMVQERSNGITVLPYRQIHNIENID
jgi:predicted AAA+ superfamily ATPase